MRKKRTAFLIPLLMAIAACGGGGGGSSAPSTGNNNPPPPPSDASPGGIYSSVFEGCVTCPFDVVGLFSESGDWFSVDTAFEAGANLGVLTIDGMDFTGTRSFYGAPTPACEFGFPPTAPARRLTPTDPRSFDGSVIERESVEGTFSHFDNRTDVAFTYDAIYERGSDLASIAGMYSVSDVAGFAITYDISDGGAISGSDSAGCNVTGSVQVMDTAFNLYELSLEYINCGNGGAAGAYTGFATLLDSSAPSGTDLLFYAQSQDESNLVVLSMPKL